MYEHFRGAGSRPTTRKTIAERSSYIVPFAAQGNLYPLFLAWRCAGIGFGVATTGSDPEYTTSSPWPRVIPCPGCRASSVAAMALARGTASSPMRGWRRCRCRVAPRG